MSKLFFLVAVGLMAYAAAYTELTDELDELYPGGLPDDMAFAQGFAGIFEESADDASEEGEEAKKGPLAELFGGILGGDGKGPFAEASLLRLMMLRRILGGQQSQQGFGPLSGLNRPSGSFARQLIMLRLMGKKFGTKLVDETFKRKEQERVYSFAASLGCDDCVHEYTDDENNMKGFSLDVVKAVCEEAGKKCITMYDAHSNCYTHVQGEHSRAGVGLMNKYYDGCLTWLRTAERLHSVKFTEPYAQAKTTSHLYVKKGGEFPASEAVGKKIGFLDGWVSDENCLLQMKPEDVELPDRMRPENAVYLKNRKELFEQLESDKLDAVFLLDISAAEALKRGFVQMGEGTVCGMGGTIHIMSRKDSTMPQWFDSTLKSMKESGKYYALCAKARQEHAARGEVECT
ncbi:uncharacterized protein LOC100367560 [Saccoglossus kowalevskii]|uniref:Uncharacterized protein LOC100367560 n=1 Tax=Saccoglossus kowalevskii TaxID=10224 RepID=A0ABM0GKY1_SACKO|nr:PREDICTED: uncharacterized protein LOC100367560 [Saccoglossus kowalevskii]